MCKCVIGMASSTGNLLPKLFPLIDIMQVICPSKGLPISNEKYYVHTYLGKLKAGDLILKNTRS